MASLIYAKAEFDPKSVRLSWCVSNPIMMMGFLEVRTAWKLDLREQNRRSILYYFGRRLSYLGQA